MVHTKISELAQMDWGSITPEFSRENEIVHVFNHSLSCGEDIARTVNFIIGKIVWCNEYFKRSFLHTVVIDDVGQGISEQTRESIREALADYTVNIRFSSEER